MESFDRGDRIRLNEKVVDSYYTYKGIVVGEVVTVIGLGSKDDGFMVMRDNRETVVGCCPKYWELADPQTEDVLVGVM